MGLFSSISSFYKKVDKAVGGILPGGSPSIFKSTTTSTSTGAKTQPAPTPTSYPSSGGGTSSSSSTNKKSSGGGSSGSSFVSKITGKGTYNPIEGTYVDPSGVGYSTATPPKDAIITVVPQAPKRGSGGTKAISNPYAQAVGNTGGVPLSVISAYERQQGNVISEKLGLAEASTKLRSARQKIRTEKLRGNSNSLREAQLLGLTALSTIVDFGKDFAELPITAYNIVKNPKVLAKLPSLIKQQGKQAGETLRVSPGEAFIQIGTEILLMKGTGKAIDEVSKFSKAKLTKLGNKYVGEAKVGETLEIPVKGGKTVELKVVGKIPKETLARQVAKAGKKIKVAISSQADTLLSAIKGRSRVIRKPIPGEEGFTQATKRLLKKFDRGTINKKELITLDRAIKKQGAKGLLERSFFADPTGKIRPSRLGVLKDKDASFLDYISGDITFKKQKPQILLFSDVKVQKLPKELELIAKKLRQGKALTKAEGDKLLKFQLKKSGKFKPVGFVSGESEITLAPGDMIKRVKKVGTTLVNKKRVEIIEAKPFTPKGKLKTLVKDFQKGKLTKKEIKKLDKLLKKETGFNYGLSSSPKLKAKYVSVRKIGANVLSKLKSPRKSISKVLSRPKRLSKGGSAKYQPRDSSGRFIKSPTSYKKPTSKKGSPPRSITKYSPPGSTSKYPKKYSPPTPRKSPRKIIGGSSTKAPPKRPGKVVKSLRIKTKFIRKTKGKQKIGFAIYEKRGIKKPKFVKLKGKPLSMKQALDRLAYRLDNKISRRAKIVPVGKFKKLGTLNKKEINYFTRNKKKFRPYKIRKGRKIPLTKAYIEKRKYSLDKAGEKAQIKLNRIAKARPRTRTLPTRKMKRGASARTQARDKNGRFIKKKR